MIFELLTTTSALGVSALATYYKKNFSKDGDKILKIAENCGLYKKDDRLRLFRRTYNKKEKYTEYVFKIPLGLELKDFTDKYGKFKDGLNNKSMNVVSLNDFKNLKFDKTIIQQIQDIFNKRIHLVKEITMSYDGMLIMKVFDEGLKEFYPISQPIMKKCKPWTIKLGKGLGKEITHNFEESPHVLVGGATDMGKSNILNLIISTLLLNHEDDVEFTLIDLKGGLEFSTYECIKQTMNFATNAEESYVALNNVVVDMEATFQELRRKGKKNVKELESKKRHFVIIDEAAELSSAGEQDKEEKALKIECENLIKDIARRGRASGIRLIYATQYPTTEIVSSQVKRNLLTRISLAVDTGTASTVILDETGAEELPLIKGRSIYKRTKKETMQSYFIDNNTIDEIVSKQPKRKFSKEGVIFDAPFQSQATPERGGYITEFEEVGLSDNKPNTNITQSKKRT
ncbi:FtsK/SpoIIIE domain-containing protein [Bacillus sp. UNCCL81]|uniref:FtsK/SpoIIIE domain-containing protein n=1 Tax=Bacillus sp. UNCCL81 TaxID=1502755 RepID=UPI0008E368F0|nr:FtsK/SpoIIIE domain-containing protein [Bacillus sp. UNCCL81]SFD43707.1 DNA segregation ATPase FtsK/SpoIIIE, S-DNA-T family [Bacillus sp. UNCCL81]